jgi:alpha-D-ribose 1-methylphosphonate 5-triphosphate synthase subunit PhnI
MAYVAVKGGRVAIENAAKYLDLERVRGKSAPLEVEQIKEQLHLLVDRVMGEGSLYAPDLAALAIKQSSGDMLESAFILRAYRTTQSRLGFTLPGSAREMRIIRRISAAFKDIPGGQVLGPTPDYSLRLMDFDLFEDSHKKRQELIKSLFRDICEVDEMPESFPKIVELLRKENLLEERTRKNSSDLEVDDVTRGSITFPASRPVSLQSMARGETGGMLLLAYSNMRGYGNVHPTVGELRVGFMPVKILHPYTREAYAVGEIKVTEAEVISQSKTSEGTPKFTLGYGLCFGHNEVKAISMAVLDRATQADEATAPSEDQEFVLSHIDGIESMGFCNHFKLPHYVTFQSSLDRLRKTQEVWDEPKAVVE